MNLDLKMRHILIGGNGFVGRETVRLILENSDDGMVVVDLPESFRNFPRKTDSRIEYLETDVSDSAPGEYRHPPRSLCCEATMKSIAF